MLYNAKNCSLRIDNTTVNYMSFGKGKKNLIIIPGVGDGFKTVKGLAFPFSIMYKIFSKDYKVYVFSRRNKIPENFTTEQMANDIIDHMNKLLIEKADIIGVSQGGMIAQYIAINAPKKVNKLVLTVTVSRSNKIIEDSVTNWIEMAKNKQFKEIMIDTAKKSYVKKRSTRGMNIYGLYDKKASYDRFIIEANACLKHNTYNELNKIKCPTLIIGARKDKVLGIEGSIELNKGIKNSELYIYEDYSHGVYEEAKDINKRVLDYLLKE